MLKNLMEDKRLDFNAPLLSVRRFASTPPPPPPSSSSAAVARAEDGDCTVSEERSRGASLPFYKSKLKSGPVRNAGVVPFVWEQTPGRPKDVSGSSSGGSRAKPLDRPPPVAPKLPPGRIMKRPIEKEESDGPDSVNPPGRGVLPRGPPPISSSSSSSNEGTAKSVEISRGIAKVKPNPAAVEEWILEEHCGDGGGSEDEEEEDAFSDALDTLSRTESCFMNCSISGLSGGMETAEPSGSFSTDPQVRDFMMGRFLPAAQAMTTGSPQWTSRKPYASKREENGGERRRPVPLPYQHRPNYVPQYAQDHHRVEGGDSDDNNDDYDGAGHLSVKACGLLPKFCLKSSFCLLNPVPGVKVRGSMTLPPIRRLSPQVGTSHNGSLGEAEYEHTWEEVYKHKLGRGHQLQGEEGSKLTSESNQLTYWSDSQTPDGSSPCRHSTGGGISPYRNNMPPSPFHEGRGFLGVPKHEGKSGKGDEFESRGKDGEQYWEITPHLSIGHGSGSVSPAVEKTVYVDSVHVPETSNSKTSSAETKGLMNSTDRDSEVAVDSQGMGESQAPEDNTLQPKVSETVDADVPSSVHRSVPPGQMDNTEDIMKNGSSDDPQPLRREDQGVNGAGYLQSLLPPPLPKSPSESWLWRTLPSVSSKNSTPQSFLGIQFHPRKQAVRTFSTDPKWETIVKPSNKHNGQMQFGDVLTKPVNEG